MANEYLFRMIRVSFSATYLSHKRFCEQLERAARTRPAFGSDPIFHFTQATLLGTPIAPERCSAIADRMERLAHGELIRPTTILASRLRSAAQSNVLFSMRDVSSGI